MLEINAGPFSFVARFEEELAPRTVERSAESSRSRTGSSTVAGAGVELDPLGRPRPGHRPGERDQLSPPGRARALSGGESETELLFPYGYCHRKSKAGELWANHFATLVEGQEQLKELGRMTLWEGAQPISFRES